MSHFKIEIFTPSSVVGRNLEANSVIVPTERGKINILPQHTHLMSKLETGVLVLEQSGGKKQNFCVTKGICKVLKDKIVILTSAGESQDMIDEERAKRALEKSQSKLASDDTMSDFEREKYMRKLVRAQVRIGIARSR
jgi:F-type H+-transporting ATPase subunit epsilon